MPSIFDLGQSLNTPSQQLRVSMRDLLLEQLRQQSQPLGQGLDPTLRASATGVRQQQVQTRQGAQAQATANTLRRLGQIEDRETRLPGRVPGGTGPTGNLDLGDHLRMLEEQREAVDLQGALQGQGAPRLQVMPGVTAFGTAPSGQGQSQGQGQGQGQSTAPEADRFAPQRIGAPTGSEQDFEIGQGIRQTTAQTRIAEAQARATELAANPLEAAKVAAGVTQFRNRRDPVITGSAPAGPGFAPGVQRISMGEGGMTELREAAARAQDPNFQPAVKGQMDELLTNPAISPAITRAMIEQQTAGQRNTSQTAIAEAREAGRLATEQARQAGMDDRQAEELGQRAAEAQLRGQIALMENAVSAERFGQRGVPFLGQQTAPGIQEAMDQTRQLLGRFGAQVQGPGGAQAPAQAPAQALPIPPEVTQGLTGQPPGTYEASDGTVWTVHPDGTITQGR